MPKAPPTLRATSSTIADLVRQFHTGELTETLIDGIPIICTTGGKERTIHVGGHPIEVEFKPRLNNAEISAITETILKEVRLQRVIVCIRDFRTKDCGGEETLEQEYDVLGQGLIFTRGPRKNPQAHIGDVRIGIPAGATNGVLRELSQNICRHL